MEPNNKSWENLLTGVLLHWRINANIVVPNLRAHVGQEKTLSTLPVCVDCFSLIVLGMLLNRLLSNLNNNPVKYIKIPYLFLLTKTKTNWFYNFPYNPSLGMGVRILYIYWNFRCYTGVQLKWQHQPNYLPRFRSTNN